VNVLGGLFNWTAFRNPAFTVYCIGGIVCLLGLYTGGPCSLPDSPCHAATNESWLTWLTDLTNSDDLPFCIRH